MDLPIELWYMIAQRCDPLTHYILSCVSWTMYDLVQSFRRHRIQQHTLPIISHRDYRCVPFGTRRFTSLPDQSAQEIYSFLDSKYARRSWLDLASFSSVETREKEREKTILYTQDQRYRRYYDHVALENCHSSIDLYCSRRNNYLYCEHAETFSPFFMTDYFVDRKIGDAYCIHVWTETYHVLVVHVDRYDEAEKETPYSQMVNLINELTLSEVQMYWLSQRKELHCLYHLDN